MMESGRVALTSTSVVTGDASASRVTKSLPTPRREVDLRRGGFSDGVVLMGRGLLSSEGLQAPELWRRVRGLPCARFSARQSR